MSLAPGSRLGSYEIRAPIGAGGMGEVYRALDPKLQRDVAIKVLPEALASDPQALARFEREARAVAALSHPHILAIHDFGVADGTAFAVMELLEGETLREKLEPGPLTGRKAAEYGVQIADGLAAAHDKGIVHRDLKPENVFVTREGRVKILDFGLARQGPLLAPGDESRSPTQSRHTDPGTVLGTAGYMSPEQVRGRPVDHRSDIFSFGCILFEMVTGTRAFRRESGVETMNAILKEDPLDAPAIEAGVPPALGRILRHCLEKAPEERFQSARDLAFDLASVTGSSTSGRAAVAGATPRRVPWALAGAATLLAAVALGYWLGASRTAHDGGVQPIAQYTRLTEEPGLEQRPSLSPDGKTLVYAAGPPDRRGIYSRRVGGRNPVLLTRDCDKDSAAPAFSPDGERIAYRSECEGGGIFVMGATGESARRVTDTGQDPAWAPDGARLVVATEAVFDPLERGIISELWLVEVGTGEKRRVSPGDAVQPAWSPDGRHIAYWGRRDPSGQRDIFIVAADGSGSVLVTDDRATDWAPQWSPDGSQLYFASDRGGTMNLWRLAIDGATGRARGTPEPIGVPAAWTGAFSRSRDGRTLAYVSAEPRSTLHVMDFDPGRGQASAPRQVFSRSGKLQSVDWSPDGASLLLNDWGRDEEIFLLRPDGGGYRELVADPFRNRFPTFAPDGGQIGFYSDRGGAYGLWSVRPDGSGLQPLSPQSLPGALYTLWSPDGRRMATTDSSSSFFILDLERPLAERLIDTLPIADAGIVTFDLCEWSPDGTRLALAGRAPDGSYSLFTYTPASRTLSKVTADVSWARWLRDSKRLLATHGNRLFLLDSTTGVKRDVLPPAAFPPHALLTAAITRDDRRIAFIERTFDGDIWAMTLP